jgi:hypothetical protein
MALRLPGIGAMRSETKRCPATRVSTRAARAFVLLPVVLGAAGCFDVRSVDPGSLLIDNFDDGAFPADSMFIPWMCYSFNPPTNQNFSCRYDTDTLDGSAHSLRLDFRVDDPPDTDMSRQYGGAGLATYGTPGLYQDVTGFGQLWFDAEVQSGNPALSSDAILYAQLGCSTVLLTDGSEPGDYFLLQSGIYSEADWKKNDLSLANFSPPDDTRQIQGGVRECLRRVDQIAFTVDAELQDGGSGAGVLKIDDVYLR